MCGAVLPGENDCQRYLHFATVNAILCMIGYFHMRGSDNAGPFAYLHVDTLRCARAFRVSGRAYKSTNHSCCQIAGGNILIALLIGWLNQMGASKA
jgi:hypothetical protein